MTSGIYEEIAIYPLIACFGAVDRVGYKEGEEFEHMETKTPMLTRVCLTDGPDLEVGRGGSIGPRPFNTPPPCAWETVDQLLLRARDAICSKQKVESCQRNPTAEQFRTKSIGRFQIQLVASQRRPDTVCDTNEPGFDTCAATHVMHVFRTARHQLVSRVWFNAVLLHSIIVSQHPPCY